MSLKNEQPKEVRAVQLRKQAKALKLELDSLVKHFYSSSTSSKGHSSGRRPSDPDVEFARRNLRNTYLSLLFTCPFTRPAHGVDALIWTDTSYSLILAYRSLLASSERALAAARSTKDDVPDANATHDGKRKAAIQEVQRNSDDFQNFLVSESAFWQELAGRIVSVFGIQEARPVLNVLRIPCEGDLATQSSLHASSQATPQRLDANAGRDAGLPSQSSSVDRTLSQSALTPGNRSQLMEAVHKALICCGDLERYSELHRTSGLSSLRPSSARAAFSRGSKGRRRGTGRGEAHRPPEKEDQPKKPARDFGRAIMFYEQARLLLPESGNPSNQLAVIATYSSDAFASTYHYYRALCARLPFEKARLNLDRTLSKAIESWQVGGPERLLRPLEPSPSSASAWLQDLVVLHGMFYHKSHLKSLVPLSDSVLAGFQALVESRTLQADQIVRVVVMGLCASWTTRLWRNAPVAASRSATRPDPTLSSSNLRSGPEKGGGVASDPSTRLCIEHQVLAHVLGIFRCLASVDARETAEAIETNRRGQETGAISTSKVDIIHNLSAVVRRTLPALRIATKWMKSHLEYIQRCGERAHASSQSSASTDSQVRQGSMDPRFTDDQDNTEAALRVQAEARTIEAISQFWRSYVELINTLRYAFPFELLPNIGTVGDVGAPALCLEEDSDMRGFAPTKKAMQQIPRNGGASSVPVDACVLPGAIRPSQVHPNEEQLMRIADLLIDAKVVAESEASPIFFDDIKNTFVYRESKHTTEVNPVGVDGKSSPRTMTAMPPVKTEEARPLDGSPSTTGKPLSLHFDEVSSEGRSEMTDDPVDLAMRAVGDRHCRSGSCSDEGAGLFHGREARTSAEETGDEEDQILIPSQVKFTGGFRQQDLTDVHGGGLSESTHEQSHDPKISRGLSHSDASDMDKRSPSHPATAQDLLLQVLNGRSNLPPSDPSRGLPPPGHENPTINASSYSAQPQFLFGGISGVNEAALDRGRASIWSPGPRDAGVHLNAPIGSPTQPRNPMHPFGSPPVESIWHSHQLAQQGFPTDAYGGGPNSTPPSSHGNYGMGSAPHSFYSNIAEMAAVPSAAILHNQHFNSQVGRDFQGPFQSEQLDDVSQRPSITPRRITTADEGLAH
ncbi:hypothetical protein IE53DRAFT_380952 [Violaceomyces palustris]|uniref:Uncharacterized protein n=1 Tax=Violaceomyces palustris TaxID=1673888 RepID=A0ACD0NT63_9BASI|nr:hypothetical protein IE53DRAFT_380952 [Violaceomyces palustris]